MTIEVKVQNYRQSPRKVRLVADLVRGKKVKHALTVLEHINKRASDPIRGAIQSAVSNAEHNHKMSPDRLYVKDIRIDEGVTLKRYMPRARGSSSPIKKRSSHIFIALDTKGDETLKGPARHTAHAEDEHVHEEEEIHS